LESELLKYGIAKVSAGGLSQLKGPRYHPVSCAVPVIQEEMVGLSGPVQPEASTEALSRFVAGLRFEDLPGPVISDATRLILDTIGVSIGGYHTRAGQIVADAAREIYGGPGGAMVLGAGRGATASEAAFVNGYLANVLDADDVLVNTSHPAGCALLPALALAEARGLSGRELIVAFVAAYEASARIGFSLVRSRLVDGKIERSSTLGMGWYAFGSTVSAGRVLGLDQGQMTHALGIAAATSPIGFARRWQSITQDKYMMKYSPTGFISADGVAAAQLARRGFTADPSILDGPFAYWELAGAFASDLPALVADLGDTWWLSEATIKPYAVGGVAIGPVEQVKATMAEHGLQPADVQSVLVETLEMASLPWFTGTAPHNQIDMGFSMPVAVSAAVFGIEMGPTWQDEYLSDSRLRELALRVRVSTHPEAASVMGEQLRTTGRIRQVPIRVTVDAKGQSYESNAVYYKGNPWSPETRLTDQEVADKFELFTRGQLGDDGAARARERVINLAEVTDVAKELTPVLRASVS
jgi:2-methylcitrate dehydratase PrpD